MTKIESPISILENGSTYIRLAIYDEVKLSRKFFFQEKIDFTRNENFSEVNVVKRLILKAEQKLGRHLNEILLLIDNSKINSLDFCIKKNFEKKNIFYKDIDYIINECEKEIKLNNPYKEILHIEKHKIIIDNNLIKNLKDFFPAASSIMIEIKFILVDKKLYKYIKNLFAQDHLSIIDIYCTSYIKCIGKIKKLEISGNNSFIDIGLKKSSLSIFNDDKLIYLNSVHIGSDHITKDISKILQIDYRKAESKKIKFYKTIKKENILNEDDLLKKIINARIEEIIEILFLNCHFVKDKKYNSDLRLFFLGNGSKLLNENLLSFGAELSFIKEMSFINEKDDETCDSAFSFYISNKKLSSQKSVFSIENKGFFERLFGLLAKK